MSAIQPLNYCPKVIEQFMSYMSTGAPLSRHGFAYLIGKLRQAQVFVMPDHGELLDRSKVRPEVPGLIFRPPYPVVALEYSSPPLEAKRAMGELTAAPCSRRIALAWDWIDDLPKAFGPWMPRELKPGVVIASLAFYDDPGQWMPVFAAYHIPYDGEWSQLDTNQNPLRSVLLEAGQITKAQAAARTIRSSIVPLLPEVLGAISLERGPQGALQTLQADLMDEVNAYTDLCYALGCRNVEAERHSQPEKLNRSRIRAGKIPLFDYHILKLTTAEDGEPMGERAHGSPRPHLRRGHIRHLRHLGPDRITWVNATMVKGHGRGFLRKDYAVERPE